MRFPKVTVALITSIIAPFVLPLFIPLFHENTYMENVFIYALYTVPMIFTYGIATSYLADYLSKRFTSNKRSMSFLFHLLFGALFVFPFAIMEPFILEEGIFNFATINGTICAAIFFTVNEVIKRWQ